MMILDLPAAASPLDVPGERLSTAIYRNMTSQETAAH